MNGWRGKPGWSWAGGVALLGALLLVAVGMVGGLAGVGAQDATGTAPAPITPTPLVPLPKECDVEPLELPLFDETPPAGDGAVETTPTPFAMPEGDLVDEDEAEAITEAIRGSLACRNEGDYLRAYAFFTERYLSELLGGREGVSLLIESLQAPPTPVAEDEKLGLVHVSEVRRLEDGRVGAVAVTQDVVMAYADYLYLVEEDGRWLIDDRVFLSETEVGAAPDS